ncbi:MAG: (4Fe-4S)-binding protein [Desulfatitalea sp. BRH_c12]|nr:MAG: (4Fe-4S)-binding protein [Desulfatitalea sp. BRH_c12]
MKVAIASGKGGTGKTMVTASLTAIWDAPVIAVDLDVEEPNLHLFLKPEIAGRRDALMAVPQVDESQCNYCRACANLCAYKAISVFNTVVLVFPEMCHGCGGCMAVCPTRAITAGSRVLGEVSWGRTGSAGFLMGRLRIGEAMSPPLIRQVQAALMQAEGFPAGADVLMDAPPGVSCPAVSAVIDSDIIVLVTEPTPFGVFDLRLAYQAFQPLGKPMGVVVNRAGLGDADVYRFCGEVGLPIFAEIPYQRAIAEAYAAGQVLSGSSETMADLFRQLANTIRQAAGTFQEVRHA